MKGTYSTVILHNRSIINNMERCIVGWHNGFHLTIKYPNW